MFVVCWLSRYLAAQRPPPQPSVLRLQFLSGTQVLYQHVWCCAGSPDIAAAECDCGFNSRNGEIAPLSYQDQHRT